MKKICFIVLCLFIFMAGLPCLVLAQQSGNLYRLNGFVRDAQGNPVRGANISLSPALNSSSGSSGAFSIAAPAGRYELRVSFVGLQSVRLAVELPRKDSLIVVMQYAENQLAAVTVSTGYQELPAERATGSFVVADRKLVERSVSTDILSRLRDVTPGLSFNTVGNQISIRGQSTLFSNASPLIVVDGFPYNQPIENLNPNDVESISVLKDAAAASIWGAKAGNGVIVISTKKGAMNRRPVITLNTNVTVGERPDFSMLNRMSSSDYIDIEKRLFSAGYFDAAENSYNHLPLSPVVETLISARDAAISNSEADRQLDALRGFDVYRDISKYFYRPAVNQQYALSLDGGSDVERYYISAGFDKNLDQQVGKGYRRVTLNANHTRKLGKNMEWVTGLNFTQSRSYANSLDGVYWNGGLQVYPYAQLKNADGSNAALVHDLRAGFAGSAPAAGLQDWQYRPIDELRLADDHTDLSDIRANTSLKYRLGDWLRGLDVQVLYQFDRTQSIRRNLHNGDSFYTRNLVNRYTYDDGSGTLVRPIPTGGILDNTFGLSVNHDLRGQLNFDRDFGSRHHLAAIAGYEIQSLRVTNDLSRVYGYDPDHATGKPVDGTTQFTYYDNPFSGAAIPYGMAQEDLTDHYRSYYANAAYTYDNRLTLSASLRLDQSNLFGVRANQKGVPLYSFGGAWNLSNEKFYHIDWLPELKLRATYGYNGNINKTLSAYTTASYFDGSDSQTQLPYATIINPPNPDLRWERIRNINLGLDFTLLGGRLGGSFEYYLKQGLDLIGRQSYPPSSGISVFTGNTAQTRGHGLDLVLNSRNLTGRFSWNTNFFLSYVTDKVSAYGESSVASAYVQDGALSGYPLIGRPLYAVYSYAWAGLDPQTGNPRGLLNGQASSDYNAILKAATPEDLVYNGPARPVVFGFLRNTWAYKNISLSANIVYKLGYYFRRRSIRYGVDQGLSQQNGDYALRWQQPGDELRTDVPSLPAAPDLQRDNLYTYSSALVEKGDHVRLQDVRIAYDLSKSSLSFAPGSTLQLYVYAANLGIIWRANTHHLDPDYPNYYAAPRTIAAGLRLTY